MEAEAGELDAVAAGIVGDHLGFEDGDGGVAVVGLEHVVGRRRQRGGGRGPLL